MSEVPAPDKNRSNRAWRLLILGVCLLMPAVTTLFGFLHGFTLGQSAWKGRVTLAVDRALPAAELDAALAHAGFTDRLSTETARVSLADGGGGLRSADWAGLRGAGDIPDPRFDDYVTRLDRLFTDRDGRWQLVYLPDDDGLINLQLKLSAALDPLGATWRLLEWQPIQGGLLALAAAAAAATLVVASRGRRLVTALAALPWIALCESAGPVFFPLELAVLISWSLFLESLVPALKRYAHDSAEARFFWDRPTEAGWARGSLRELLPFLEGPSVAWRGAAFLAVQVLAAACAFLQGSADILPGMVVVHVMAWPSLVCLLARVYQLRRRRSEHRLFAPVPMLTTRRTLVTGLRPVLIPLAIAGVAVPFALMLPLGRVGDASVPVPASGGAWGGYAAAREAWFSAGTAPAESGLPPGPADAAIHLAYQSALPWIAHPDPKGFTPPEPGTAYGPLEYAAGAEGVSAKTVPRVTIDQAWFDRTVRSLPPSSAERLLLEQGPASGLVFAAQGKVYSADVWIIPALAGLVAFVLPFWMAGRNPGYRQLYGSSRISHVLRKVAA